MVKCSYCENISVQKCCKCHKPVCNKHSHYKDHVFDNLYDANVAGHKYTYEIYCNDCDVNFLSFDIVTVIIAFIFVIGFLTAIASLFIMI